MLKSEEFSGMNLLFTGSLDYFPNTQGIQYFCSNVLPVIRATVPEVTLQVVGKNPTLQIERILKNTNRVWYSYNVRDIRPFYYQSTVFVVPLLTGAGTRLKILEAMAVGLPVVSTSKGCDGLGLSNGQGIVIEDNPVKMAAAIIRLLQDASYRRDMSETASKVCQERFSWDRIFEMHQAT
jgi:glycosyltransferase involved in cell wall biosynthesis